jgi:hypothetical protein
MYNFTQLTQQQKTALQAIVDKYAAVEGSYEATMLGGIVHAYCDSGILSDAYSVEDVERLSVYFTEEGIYMGDLHLISNFMEGVEERALDCVTAINAINAVCDDTELGAAYIGRLLGNLMQNCYTE